MQVHATWSVLDNPPSGEVVEILSGGRKVQCSSCHLRAGYLPAGDRLGALFVVWSGFFKTVVSSNVGREQVMGLQTAGEMLGLDGMQHRRTQITDPAGLQHLLDGAAA